MSRRRAPRLGEPANAHEACANVLDGLAVSIDAVILSLDDLAFAEAAEAGEGWSDGAREHGRRLREKAVAALPERLDELRRDLERAGRALAEYRPPEAT